MATTFRTESIVIKKEPWREYDRLYVLYTREAGKIRAMAKGSRRSLSRMAGHLEPFLITDVMIARGRQIDKLAGSEQVVNYHNLDRSLEKVALLNYCFEVLDALTSYEHPDRRIYDLVKEFLQAVEDGDFGQQESLLVSRVFTIKLLVLLGYEPSINNCLDCRRRIVEKEASFSPMRGGIICQACSRRSDFNQISLTPDTISVIKSAIFTDIGKFFQIKILPETARPFDLVIDEFLKYHLDGPLASEKYFYQVFA